MYWISISPPPWNTIYSGVVSTSHIGREKFHYQILILTIIFKCHEKQSKIRTYCTFEQNIE